MGEYVTPNTYHASLAKFRFPPSSTRRGRIFRYDSILREAYFFYALFGYDSVGVLSRKDYPFEESERSKVENAVKWAVAETLDAYREYEANFLSHVCPSEGGFEFRLRDIVVDISEFLDTNSGLSLDDKVAIAKTIAEDIPSREVRILTGENSIGTPHGPGNEFDIVVLVVDRIYIEFEHRLEDPMIFMQVQSYLTSFLYWNFYTSLMLKDCFYDIRDVVTRIDGLRSELKSLSKDRGPIEGFRKRVLRLRRELDAVLRNTSDLSGFAKALYRGLIEARVEGIPEAKRADAGQLLILLHTLKTRFDSEDEARSVLDHKELGSLDVLTANYRDLRLELAEARADVESKELLSERRAYKIQLGLFAVILLSVIIVPLVVPSYPGLLAPLSLTGEVFHIGTFFVAMVILLTLRRRPVFG